MPRARVFLSYSHEDEQWRERLVQHLSPLVRGDQVDLWDVRSVATGDDVRARIQEAIESAKVAVFLVSPAFLASDVIHEHELPALLSRHRADGLVLLPVLVRPCAVEHVDWLESKQLLPRDGRPLARNDEVGEDALLADIAREIHHLLSKEAGSRAQRKARSSRPLLDAAVRPPPAREPQPQRETVARPSDETRLLERVKSFWIHDVLHTSLNDEMRIELTRQERTSAVKRALDLSVERLDEDDRPLDPGESIADYFDRRQRALLILGEPGSGKTVTLLELAEALLAQAAADPALPVPVVLQLASWGFPTRVMGDWVVKQLELCYHVPRRVGRQWLDAGRLTFLFDGLDEVGPALRSKCVSAINRFRREHGLSSIAVTCRRAEYEALSARLELDAAIQLQDLSNDQIASYLEAVGAPLADLSGALAEDPGLRELARSPLMLNVMSFAYSGDGMQAEGRGGSVLADPEERRREIFEAYVERMLRRPQRTGYSRERTLKSLIWLARDQLSRKQAVFSLEQLQPWSLPSGGLRLVYFLVSRVIAATSLGFLLGWGCWEAAFEKYYRFPFLGVGMLSALPMERASIAAIGAAIGLLLGLADHLAARSPSSPEDSWRSRLAHFGVPLGCAAVVVLLDMLIAGGLGRTHWVSIGLGVVAAVAFGLRRRRLAMGQDVAPVESLRVRWKLVAALGFLLVLLPGAVALRYSLTNALPQLWSIPPQGPNPVPASGEARFITDDRAAVVGYIGKPLTTVDLRTGRAARTPVCGDVAFDTSGRKALGYPCEDKGSVGALSVWDVETWRPHCALEAPSGQPASAEENKKDLEEKLLRAGFGLRGSRVVSSLAKYYPPPRGLSVRIHDTATGKLLLTQKATSFRIASDDRHVVVDENNGLSLRRLEDGALAIHFDDETWGRVCDADVHPSGRWLAVVDYSGWVFRLDMEGQSNPRPLAEASGSPPERCKVLFSPDGTRFVVVSEPHISLFDSDGTLVHRLSPDEPRLLVYGPDSYVEFSSDGAVFIERASLKGHILRSSDGADLGALPASIPGPTDISPDGSRMLTPPLSSEMGWLVTCILFAVVGLLITLLSAFQAGVVKMKTLPNEGIRLTARWSLIIGVGCAAPLAAVLAVLERTDLVVAYAVSKPLLAALAGALFALLYGGFDLFQHHLLRALLALRGDLPWRSARFLDGAARQIFLRRVGGAYIFIHRLLLEYFARDAHRLLASDHEPPPPG